MSAQSVIQLEDVARMPAPASSAPSQISFTPDGQYVTYLQSLSGELTQKLYGFDVDKKVTQVLAEAAAESSNTEEKLSHEEKLRRERTRSVGVGITSYSWSPIKSEKRALLVLQGNLYVKDVKTDSLTLIFDKESTGAAGGAIDPQWSPDGSFVAFVQEGEIYIVNSRTENGQAKQITFGARESGKTHGLADFIAQEEMDRYRGFWWSPDGSEIAFQEVDERHIPVFRIMHSGKDQVGEGAQEDHRYPFAGEENPHVRIGVVHANLESEKPPIRWLDWGEREDTYLARVNWFGHSSLAIQQQNREQSKLDLILVNSKTGESSVVLTEKSDVWINLHYLLRHVGVEKDGSIRFLWGSERTGFMHLYLYRYNPNNKKLDLLCNVTEGDWMVENIVATSQVGSVISVYYTSTKDSPLSRHLYVSAVRVPSSSCSSSSIVASRPLRLTSTPAMHSVAMDPKCETLVDVINSLERPPMVKLFKLPSPPADKEGSTLSAVTSGSFTIPPTSHKTKAESALGLAEEVEGDSTSLSDPTPLGHCEEVGVVFDYALPHGEKFEETDGATQRGAQRKTEREAPAQAHGQAQGQGQVQSETQQGESSATKKASADDSSGLVNQDPHYLRLQEAIRPPRIVELTTRAGHRLFAALYEPDPEKYGKGPKPTVVSVYGGPHAQRVQRAWNVTADMRAQRLRDLGYLVLKLDNRGSARRGLAFEGHIKNSPGTVEVDDQKEAVEWLVSQGLADPARVGIYGWSYGGYMSLMCLMREPDTFKLAVSGAPVTSWDGYDTHYTERYFSTPEKNQDGYARGSVMSWAKNMKDTQHLLLIHGLLDENVHWRHTARLVKALIAERKNYDLCIFPDERHLPRQIQDRVYMEQRIFNYIEKNLRRDD